MTTSRDRLACGLTGMLTLGGCAAVSSTEVSRATAGDRTSGRLAGEPYSLPRTVLTAQLRYSDQGGAAVTFGTPVTMADTGVPLQDHSRIGAAETPRQPAGSYILSHRVSGFHQDGLKISTSKGLLTTISADTKEKTSEAAVEFAGSIGQIVGFGMRLESAVAGEQDEILASWTFDPADCLDRAAVNQALRQQIASAVLPRVRAAGGEQARAAATVRPRDYAIELRGYTPFRYAPAAGTSPADCSVGICVPAVRSGTIALTGPNGGGGDALVLDLPNGSDPVPIPVGRSLFADVKTDLALTNGILTTREITRSAEALAIAKLPGAVLGAFAGGIVTGLSLTQKASEAELKAMAEVKKLDAERREKEAKVIAAGPPVLRVPLPGLGKPRLATAPGVTVMNVPNNSGVPPTPRTSSGSTGQP